MICAVTKYYQGDKIEDDEMGGLWNSWKNFGLKTYRK